MWGSVKTLTSYQDFDGRNVLLLLDKNYQPVFDMQGKCDILQYTFFRGKHIENNNFDNDFKLFLEKELHDIPNNP